MTAAEIPFKDQLLAFKTCLTRRGMLAALELLNARTNYRYTALSTLRKGILQPLHVFDRLHENRAYLQSAQFLNALGGITMTEGGFISSNCRQDGRLRPLDGLIVSYCGLVLAPMGGEGRGVLCHFDMSPCEVRPCELAFLRAVAPLLLDYLN